MRGRAGGNREWGGVRQVRGTHAPQEDAGGRGGGDGGDSGGIGDDGEDDGGSDGIGDDVRDGIDCIGDGGIDGIGGDGEWYRWLWYR